MTQSPRVTEVSDDVVLRVIASHRTVRRFKPDPVLEGDLEKIIRAGQHASTHFSVQAYSVISVHDPVTRERLFALCGEQRQIKECPVFLVVCPDLHRFELATEMSAGRKLNGELTDGLILSLLDSGLVLQNMAIAAESMGLGICMIGAIRKKPKDVSDLLKLPRHVFPASGLCVGYAAQDPEQKPRLPLEAVWHREVYMDDERLREHIRSYDRVMVEYHAERGLDAERAEWSSAMAAKPLSLITNGGSIAELIQHKGFFGDSSLELGSKLG